MKINPIVAGILAAVVICACVLLATGCTKADENQPTQQTVRTQ